MSGIQRVRAIADGLAAGVGVTGAGALVAGALTGGAWIVYSALGVDHHMPLPPAIDAPRRSFNGARAGALSYYADDTTGGRPLVLIHSINAAASAYEMRPLFERYRGVRPVYALDLPGFGCSDRSDRVYSVTLYTAAIVEFLRDELRGQEPADVVALSLGCEFAARAALQEPALFRSLTLISPSGFSARGTEGASQRASREGSGDRLYRAFAFPLWAQGLYDLLTTRPSIAYFLKQSFEGPPDPGLVAYDYATGHQPGARHAPLYFISGTLFSPDIRQAIYESVTLPVLVLYDRDNFVRFDTLPEVLSRHPNWHATRITPTKGLPHFEELDQTAAALAAFWSHPASEPV